VFYTNREGVKGLLPLVPQPVIQECLKGPEITVDALISSGGKVVHYVPRRRIRTLAGESIQGVTIDDHDLRSWLIDVLNTRNLHLNAVSAGGGRGPVTLQAFITDTGPVLTEVNPRFGGGYPLSHAAGGRYTDWIVADLEGRPIQVELGSYVRGLHMSRFHVEHFAAGPLWT
jgi:carbamoyl-phosphate synthase large subunit